MNKTIISLISIGAIILAVSSISLITIQNMVFIENDEDFEISKLETKLDEENPIRVGILHSLSGTMEISESPVVDMMLLAIDEINEGGGIIGKKVIPIIKDGKSDELIFKKESKKLIEEENVDVVFGGWTSASRKSMKPVFEEHNHLLFYPVQYEGLEKSPNIIYTGAAPNQQAVPAIKWAFESLGDRFFLVGSDYVFPRSVNEILKDEILKNGGTVVGEEYRLLGDKNFKNIVEKIILSKPDVIINSINGDSNFSFFTELRNQGIYSNNIPTISLSIAEEEIQYFDIKFMEGDFAAWNYFQSVDNKKNKELVKKFKEKFGENRVITDPMEAGHTGMYLYAKAVEKANSTDPTTVRNALKGITLSSPSGTVGIDPSNQHLAKIIRIGQILPDGQFKIISSTEKPIKPDPYPSYKTVSEWEEFLNSLYMDWGEKWANTEREGT